MSRFHCRQLDREGTDAVVDVDIPDTAADKYVHECVEMNEGDATFVEVQPEGSPAGAPWVTWYVACVDFLDIGLLGYETRKTTEKAGRRFIRIAMKYGHFAVTGEIDA